MEKFTDRTSAYEIDLHRIAHATHETALSYDTARMYMNTLLKKYEGSSAYTSFDTLLLKLGGEAVSEHAHDSRDLTEGYLVANPMVGTPIREGFLLGMSINDQLLASKYDDPARPSVDLIEDHVVQLITSTVESLPSATDKIARLADTASVFYRDSQAHPEEPDAFIANSADNPLEDTIYMLCDVLYTDMRDPDHPESIKRRDEDTQNFERGFGIARYAYNSYRHQITQGFDDALQSQAADISHDTLPDIEDDAHTAFMEALNQFDAHQKLLYEMLREAVAGTAGQTLAETVGAIYEQKEAYANALVNLTETIFDTTTYTDAIETWASITIDDLKRRHTLMASLDPRAAFKLEDTDLFELRENAHEYQEGRARARRDGMLDDEAIASEQTYVEPEKRERISVEKLQEVLMEDMDWDDLTEVSEGDEYAEWVLDDYIEKLENHIDTLLELCPPALYE